MDRNELRYRMLSDLIRDALEGSMQVLAFVHTEARYKVMFTKEQIEALNDLLYEETDAEDT